MQEMQHWSYMIECNFSPQEYMIEWTDIVLLSLVNRNKIYVSLATLLLLPIENLHVNRRSKLVHTSKLHLVSMLPTTRSTESVGRGINGSSINCPTQELITQLFWSCSSVGSALYHLQNHQSLSFCHLQHPHSKDGN